MGDDDRQQQLRRQMRVIGLLHACERVGKSPLPAQDLHLIAYFADALAPVWGLRIVDAQLLKRRSGPLSPALQHDLDLLVGRRIVLASDVRHLRDKDGSWRIDARYALNAAYADGIFDLANTYPEQREQLGFVREVVFAMSALGMSGMAAAVTSDASYGNDLIDDGGMVDIASDARHTNASARVALKFGELGRPQTELAPAEMIHLYVRELYTRLRHAA